MWTHLLLPYLEQESIYRDTLNAMQQDSNFYDNPPHTHLTTVISVFTCSSDWRLSQPITDDEGNTGAYASYFGNMGTVIPRGRGSGPMAHLVFRLINSRMAHRRQFLSESDRRPAAGSPGAGMLLAIFRNGDTITAGFYMAWLITQLMHPGAKNRFILDQGASRILAIATISGVFILVARISYLQMGQCDF